MEKSSTFSYKNRHIFPRKALNILKILKHIEELFKKVLRNLWTKLRKMKEIDENILVLRIVILKNVRKV